jgi:hypothetical protein
MTPPLGIHNKRLDDIYESAVEAEKNGQTVLLPAREVLVIVGELRRKRHQLSQTREMLQRVRIKLADVLAPMVLKDGVDEKAKHPVAKKTDGDLSVSLKPGKYSDFDDKDAGSEDTEDA